MALSVWTKNSGYSFGIFEERQTLNLPLPVQNDTATTLLIGNVGTGYPINGGSFPTTGGNGTGMTVQVFSPNGYLQAVSINNLGVGYRDGDIITILAGGNNATVILRITVLVTYRVISGNLPRGLRIQGNKIVGTPFEVPRTTEFKFCIRASKQVSITDRTFYMTVQGSDEPNWLTPAGALPVGSNNAYYIIDDAYIDFQLSASDTDTATGQTLKFFIASDEGELPPGLIMTDTGRITGFVQPLLSVALNAGEGPFDTDLYDSVAYDFGYRPTNGYDTYVYDLTVYDFFVPTGRPRKLNRNYEFIATITDGDTVTKRKYRIFVVGEDFFRSDNVIMTTGSGTYTADITYVRAPIFTTPSDLGIRRANNYQTFKIDTWEGFVDLGPITYQLAEINARMNALCIKEVASDNRIGSTTLRFERATDIPVVGYCINFNGDFAGATGQTYTITDVDVLGGDIYRVTVDVPLEVTVSNGTPIFMGDPTILPPGMSFDPINAEIFGTVPYQPAITKEFSFTVKAIRFGQSSELSTSRRVFSVKILGEIESVMSWNTNSSLGIIDAGYISSLFVSASSTFNGTILYRLTDGKLPPGLSLNFDGEIVGKTNEVNQIGVYKSFWKPLTNYGTNDIIKKDNVQTIISIVRRKNIVSAVTSQDHGFKNNSLVSVTANDVSFNSFTTIAVNNDPIKILSRSGSGSNYVTLSIPAQKNRLLAPTFPTSQNSMTGTAATASAIPLRTVTVKSTSGSGVGAQFKFFKPSDSSTRYYGISQLTLVNPGTGYLPGDTITISGAQLDGSDITNDFTFKIPNGLEYWYKVNGNSNSSYNGRYFASASTDTSITLCYLSDPGTFGSGTISVTIDNNTFEGQTQITPLNYFNYSNKGTSTTMAVASGAVIPEPTFYKAKTTHISDLTFNGANWSLYKFPVDDLTITGVDVSSDVTTFDNGTNTYDRTYTFTIEARDPLGYSAIERDFNIVINTPNQKYYSNVTVRPFLKHDQRNNFKSFINSYEVFTPGLVYRPYDPSFGLQKELRMLVYAGIETKTAEEYIRMMAKNHKSKRFKFGEIKKALAKLPGTNDVVYEVIYVEMLDPLEKGKKHLPQLMKLRSGSLNVTVDQNNEFYNGPFTTESPAWSRPNPFLVTLDSSDVFAGDSGTAIKFPSSISLWRYRIKNMLDTTKERHYLPLWMRSIQENSVTELDYVAAIPLCFCKPGGADYIMLNIKNYLETTTFDLKNLDYTVDRYIIDSVDGGYNTDKYLVFNNDRTSIT